MTLQVSSKFHARLSDSRGAVDISITCKSSDRDLIPEGAAQYIAEAFLEAGICWDAKPIPFTVLVVQLENIVLNEGIHLHPEAFRNDGFVYFLAQRSGRCIQYKVGGHRSLKVGKIFQLLGRKFSTLKPDYNRSKLQEEVQTVVISQVEMNQTDDSPVKRIFCEAVRMSSGSHIRRGVLVRVVKEYGLDPSGVIAQLLQHDWMRPADDTCRLYRVTSIGKEQFGNESQVIAEPSIFSKILQLDKLICLLAQKDELAQMARGLKAEAKEYGDQKLKGLEGEANQALGEVNQLLETIEELRIELAIAAWPLSRQIK